MNELKKARFLKGISQARLAKEMGVDMSVVSRIENNLLRDTPAVHKQKARIAEILGAPIEKLFPKTTKQEKGR